MKEKIFGVIAFALVVISVIANTVILHRNIDKIHESVDKIEINDNNCEIAKVLAEDIYELFRKRETFIGLTVNHDDLSEIEDCFSELIAYLRVDDADSASVAKNRLTDALSHLRRLSGFNIDAII